MSQRAAHVAGSDTREALRTRTVRRAGAAAMLAAGVAWAASAMSAAAWNEHLGVERAAPWLVPLCIALGVGGGITAWRMRVRAHTEGTEAWLGTPGLLLLALLSFVASLASDPRLIAVSLPLMCLAVGLVIAELAGLASSACVPQVRPAAAGIVVAYSLGGIVPGVHLMLVGQGAGPERAALWTALYLSWCAVMVLRARAALPADVSRITARNREEVQALDPSPLGMRGITVRFGANTVLDSADLTVASGELLALVGGNGAGKSTLLRVAAGFVPLEQGRVTVAGEDVTALDPEERSATGLCFVSGARPVFPELTVLQNLRVAAYRTHRTSAAFAEATEGLLQLIPTLKDRRDAIVGVLSGGEQRLLAVAQTLYRRPEVLLADELTLGLDVDARHAVMDLLQQLAAEGVAVVCVDHDLPSLLPRSNRAAIVADGKVTSHEDPVELLSSRRDLLPATFLAGVDA